MLRVVPSLCLWLFVVSCGACYRVLWIRTGVALAGPHIWATSGHWQDVLWLCLVLYVSLLLVCCRFAHLCFLYWRKLWINMRLGRWIVAAPGLRPEPHRRLAPVGGTAGICKSPSDECSSTKQNKYIGICMSQGGNLLRPHSLQTHSARLHKPWQTCTELSNWLSENFALFEADQNRIVAYCGILWCKRSMSCQKSWFGWHWFHREMGLPKIFSPHSISLLLQAKRMPLVCSDFLALFCQEPVPSSVIVIVTVGSHVMYNSKHCCQGVLCGLMQFLQFRSLMSRPQSQQWLAAQRNKAIAGLNTYAKCILLWPCEVFSQE